MKQDIYDVIAASPVIAAIKDDEGLFDVCSNDEIKVVFVLYGDVLKVNSIIGKLKDEGKIVFQHIDLVTGLGTKDVVVDYLKRTGVDGIITTRPTLIKRAKELGLATIMRFFILDSMSLENAYLQISQIRPDMIEVLPGTIHKTIAKIVKKVSVPVIAGGLIVDREDVIGTLNAGAVAISTSNRTVWEM